MKVTLSLGVVGPRHDPYSTSLLIVENEGRTATYYHDGLGQNKVTLKSESEYREIEWFDVGSPSLQLRMKRFKARLLFKRLVGITLDEADEIGYHRNH